MLCINKKITIYTVESETITLVNPIKTSYNFLGWAGTNVTTSQTTITIPQGSTGNRVYTANWEKINSKNL